MEEAANHSFHSTHSIPKKIKQFNFLFHFFRFIHEMEGIKKYYNSNS